MTAPNSPPDPSERDLLESAAQYLPGTSAWMWSLPPELAFIVERGEGSRICDTRGRTYIDYVMGSGPLPLGHAHPAVVQAVQLSGNPLACAAGIAALAELKRPGVYDRLGALGRRLREGVAAIVARQGVPMQVLGEGPVAQPFFIDPGLVITQDSDLRSADGKRATRLAHELIRRGIFVVPGAKMYVSLAHSAADVEATLAVFDDAVRAVA